MKEVVRTPVVRDQPTSLEGFPFDVEFQKSLLRLMVDDTNFAITIIPHIKATYFENEGLSWVFNCIRAYREQYSAIPTLEVIFEETKKLSDEVRGFYQIIVESVMIADLRSEDWLRDNCKEFISRNIFTRAYQESREKYNSGKLDESYEVMMRAMDLINNVKWESKVDREWFFENFIQRYSRRMSVSSEYIPTGFTVLDRILGGGLPIGEMGIWVAYPKRGKTTLLTNLGVQALRRDMHNVLHIVLEGSRKQVAARYDTIFAQAAYWEVKASLFSDDVFKQMQYEYQMYSRRLVIRGLVDRWNYSAADIEEEKRELKRLYNWEPQLIIVDYGDLLRGRRESYSNETAEQRDAFRDLKTLANRGYGLWTASQSQRPTKSIEEDDTVLESRKIADCYDKVRVADFLGTINQTGEERRSLQMRLLAEMYRDNEADKLFHVLADFSKMTIRDWLDIDGPLMPIIEAQQQIKLNYVGSKNEIKPIQQKAFR